MYSVNNQYSNDNRMLDKTELMDISGFLMGGEEHTYKVCGSNIRKINISSKNLANNIIMPKVEDKYNELIQYLTSVLIDDDDDGDDSTYREALNRIERFRLLIKNKYRMYLTRSELEHMSRSLVLLQKELNKRLLEIHNSYIDSMESKHTRGR